MRSLVSPLLLLAALTALPASAQAIAPAKSGAVLDAKLGERLPGLLPRARQVTLRQALAHTGGLPDYIRDEKFIEKLQSSDTDNIVVGLMAEVATGVSYERLLARLTYSPLGLRATSMPRPTPTASSAPTSAGACSPRAGPTVAARSPSSSTPRSFPARARPPRRA